MDEEEHEAENWFAESVPQRGDLISITYPDGVSVGRFVRRVEYAFEVGQMPQVTILLALTPPPR